MPSKLGKNSTKPSKLSSTGHRLVYEILEQERTVFVVSVGLRDDAKVYNAAKFNTDT